MPGLEAPIGRLAGGGWGLGSENRLTNPGLTCHPRHMMNRGLCLTSLPLAGVLAIATALPCLSHGQVVQWTANLGGNGHYYQAVPAPIGITWSSAQAIAANR